MKGRRSRWVIAGLVATSAVVLLAAGPGAGHADLPPSHPEPTGPVVEVAAGRSGDLVWSLTTYPSDEGSCVDLVVTGAENLSSGGCGFGAGPVGIASTGGSGLGRTFVYGPVTDAAATVAVVFADGRNVSVPTIATPSAGRFYVLDVAGVATAVAATALDSRGVAVGDIALPAGPP